VWQARLQQFEISREEELELRSPASEWVALIETPVWKDLQDILLLELARTRDSLEDLGSSATPDVSLGHFAYMQGICHSLRILLEMPEAMIEQLREQQEERKGRQEDGEEAE